MDYQKQQQLTIPVVQVYLAIEEQILLNIAKRLKEHKSLLTEDDIHSWESLKLAELGSLTQSNIITIAKHSGLAIDAISKMLQKAGYSTVEEFENDLQEAVRQGALINPPPAIADSTVLSGILAAYQAQAQDIFNLVNTTMLGQAEQAYIDVVNQTVGKVLTGVSTPQEALREAAERWAEKGIPALVDKAGRKWSTEAYINMVTRSMVSKVSNEMQTARFQEYGVDLVEISSHADSRPSHIPFQGNIYSISGQSIKYPPLSETGYGTIEGIGGINCRHVLYPYIEGLSIKRFPHYDEVETKKRYAESQKQRYLERRIRQAKREKAMFEAMGDEEGARKAAAKVRERQAVMREFIRRTERTRRYDREQIV
jgi:hypothetical protein